MLLKESKGFCGLRVFSCVGSKIVALETRVAYILRQQDVKERRFGDEENCRMLFDGILEWIADDAVGTRHGIRPCTGSASGLDRLVSRASCSYPGHEGVRC